MMNRNYNEEETRRIVACAKSQLLAGTPVNVLMSWGITQFAYTTWRDMPTLVVTVNGFLHRGPVFICYNGGEDLYEVYLVKNHTKEVEVVKFVKEVYADVLGDTVDRLVERGDCSLEKYYKKIEESILS